MNTFFVTYDLLTPGKDYQRLYNQLNTMGAKRVLLSVWAIKGYYTAGDIRTTLKAHIDSNDRLLVVQSADWATFNALVDINQM